jgi:uncharacterized protein
MTEARGANRKHVAHATAHRWLAEHLAEGLGFLSDNGEWLCASAHESALSGSGRGRRRARHVLAKLETAKSSGHHEFWPDDVSLTDAALFDRSRFRGHQQVTDAYLLAMAVKHGGCLVTFDSAIPLEIATGALAGNLETI